jgi:NAD(P)-dependent dehydrogenase (short-subunit alcohol dehydrogenase family)
MVVINGRHEETVAQTVHGITERGYRAIGHAEDVRTLDGAGRLLDYSIEELGGVDILVNSVGEKRMGGLLDISEDDWNYAISTELTAVFCMTKVAARHMVDRGQGGRIITIAGGSGLFGSKGDGAHAAAKAAVINANMTWAQELRPYAITVNALRGGVRTDYVQGVVNQIRAQDDRPDDEVMSDRDMGFFEPEEAAPLAAWLASDEATDVTGWFLGIDGPRLTVWEPVGPNQSVFHFPSFDVDTVNQCLSGLLDTDRRVPIPPDLLLRNAGSLFAIQS